MKLTLALQLAIAAYYLNRANQRDSAGDLREGYEWNKKADLDAIDAAAAKSKLVFCASTGTFWFGRSTKNADGTLKSRRVWTISQSHWRTPVRVKDFYSIDEVKPRKKPTEANAA